MKKFIGIVIASSMIGVINAQHVHGTAHTGSGIDSTLHQMNMLGMKDTVPNHSIIMIKLQ